MMEPDEAIAAVMQNQSSMIHKQANLDEKINNFEGIALSVMDTLKNAVVSPSHTSTQIGAAQMGAVQNDGVILSKKDYLILTDKVNDLFKKIAELKEEAGQIKQHLSELDSRYEELAQYLRRCNLLFHGLRLPSPKVTGINFLNYILPQINALMPNLDLKLTWEDVNIAHPLPTASGKKTCVIILFVRRLTVMDIYKKKRILKGTGVTVTEHLTKYNLSLLELARAATSYKRAWTKEGKIFVVHNNNKILIKSKEHLESLGDISVEQTDVDTNDTHNNSHAAINSPPQQSVPSGTHTENGHFSIDQHAWHPPSVNNGEASYSGGTYKQCCHLGS